jgi:hypothetical protein
MRVLAVNTMIAILAKRYRVEGSDDLL